MHHLGPFTIVYFGNKTQAGLAGEARPGASATRRSDHPRADRKEAFDNKSDMHHISKDLHQKMLAMKNDYYEMVNRIN